MSLGPPSFTPAIEILHGETVVDPYQWLEYRGLPETNHWIYEQRKRSEAYFAACPGISTIRTRVRNYLDVETLDQPSRVRGRYFYRRRKPSEEQACIYSRDIATGEERLLVDPAVDGKLASVSIYRISDDGNIMAYELRCGGEDKTAVGFIDVNRGCSLGARIKAGYPRGLVLRPQEGGFYYCHENRGDSDEHAIRFRSFGESGAGRVVFRAPRSRESRLLVTADTVHLGILWLRESLGRPISDFLIAVLREDLRWVKVFCEKDRSFHPFLHQGRIFAGQVTAEDESSISEFSSDGREIRTVVSAGATPIREIAVAADRIYVNRFDYRAADISCWSLNGNRLGSVDTPQDGTITLLPHRSANEQSIFYAFESFEQPPTLFEYDSTGRSRVFHRRSLEGEATSLRVSHCTFPGKDGTEVPLTLVRKSGRSPDCEGPAVLTVYGGFGASMTPQFSVLATILIENGALLALAHIRGGGEFGARWHEAGCKRNRQTGIDDLLSSAEWLCNRGITTPKQLGIFGASNAGLMVAAAMTQRPSLFGAVLSIAPLLDMVRYEHFDLAVRWRSEYGTVKNPDDFRALISYSPYHRIKEDVNYPPTMFVVGDRDDRCNPAHVRKTAARLQNRLAQISPVIVDDSEDRGHMPALPLSVRVDALALRIAFLSRELNIAPPSGGHSEAICH